MTEIKIISAADPAAQATSRPPSSKAGRLLEWRRYGLPAGAFAAAALVGLVLAVASPSVSRRPGTGTDASAPTGFGAPLRIERVSQNSVSVQIVDSQASAEQMTHQLQAQGLKIRVDTVPASRQVVGLWVSAGFSEDVPRDVAADVTSQFNGYVATIDIPVSASGEIALTSGRAPKSGEQPVVTSSMVNAIAPGGWLGCLHATGGDPQEVSRQAAGWGYTVTWADGDTGNTAALTSPRPGQRVVLARIDDTTPATVRLITATPRTRRYEGWAKLGYSPRQWTERATTPATCTPAER